MVRGAGGVRVGVAHADDGAKASKKKANQKQLACAMCYKRMLALDPDCKIADVSKCSTYCSLCLKPGALERGIISSKTCVPIHDPLTRGHKRKRGDPFCDCWAEHIRDKHPGHVVATLPTRVTSPISHE